MKEISPKDWQQLCKRLNEICKGSRVSITETRNGTDASVAESTPLVSFTFDEKSDACSNMLTIATGSPGTKPLQHVITEPISIRLQNGTNDRFNVMQVLAESGSVMIEFNPGLTAESLENLSPS